MKNHLKLALAVVSMLGVLAVVTGPAWAQDDEIPPEPIPIPIEKLDLNGTWNFETSEPTVTGKCPAGNAVSGTAAITQDGTKVTLKYLSGVKCRPAEVCLYAGTLDEENQFVVSNSVVVDNEGGKVTNEVHLTVFNNELAKGTAMNRYIHPSGFECRWTMKTTFTRGSGDDEGE